MKIIYNNATIVVSIVVLVFLWVSIPTATADDMVGLPKECKCLGKRCMDQRLAGAWINKNLFPAWQGASKGFGLIKGLYIDVSGEINYLGVDFSSGALAKHEYRPQYFDEFKSGRYFACGDILYLDNTKQYIEYGASKGKRYFDPVCKYKINDDELLIISLVSGNAIKKFHRAELGQHIIDPIRTHVEIWYRSVDDTENYELKLLPINERLPAYARIHKNNIRLKFSGIFEIRSKKNLFYLPHHRIISIDLPRNLKVGGLKGEDAGNASMSFVFGGMEQRSFGTDNEIDIEIVDLINERIKGKFKYNLNRDKISVLEGVFDIPVQESKKIINWGKKNKIGMWAEKKRKSQQ